jgi:prevent-host-death family protein
LTSFSLQRPSKTFAVSRRTFGLRCERHWKRNLSRYLREAETQEIVITRHGKPAGVLIGFESEEDWFD